VKVLVSKVHIILGHANHRVESLLIRGLDDRILVIDPLVWKLYRVQVLALAVSALHSTENYNLVIH
jgi:hypothetical protein